MADKRIYMIGGVGSVGKLIAYSLRNLPKPPPVTLLVHTLQLLQQWQNGKKVITLEKDGKPMESRGYDVELTAEYGRPDPEDAKDIISNEPIHNLLVITKAAYTVPNLIRVAHRLDAGSTICFLQNGMGIVDEVNEKIFPDPSTRPNYMQGIITHGMNTPPEIMARDPFYAVHGGQGAIYLARLPRQRLSPEEVKAQASDPKTLHEDQWPATARYLLYTITQSPLLSAVGITPTELIQQQLQKLAVNSVVNPLTSLLNAPNGALLQNDALRSSILCLLEETSQIIRALPELQGIPDIEARLGVNKLEEAVIKQCEGTPHNISSMLSDLRIGQQTEIGYINGYIVRRGEELGMKAPANYAIMVTVVGKGQLAEQEKKREREKL
jgi:2-dehydropantoate 2-reductase